MDQCDLFPGETAGLVHRGWQIIEAARAKRLTAALILRSATDVQVYLRDGEVYFAEPCEAMPLSMRLQSMGVLSRDQVQRSVMLINGAEHLGRIFERDATIDRHAVELAVEVLTEEALTSIASATVTSYEVAIYRRHPSGIDRWSAPGVSPAITDSIPAVVPSSIQPVVAAAAVTPVVETVCLTPMQMPTQMPITTQMPMLDSMLDSMLEPGPPSRGSDFTELAGDPGFDDDTSLSTGFSISVADEIAEVVRRALASIDAAAHPPVETISADLSPELSSAST